MHSQHKHEVEEMELHMQRLSEKIQAMEQALKHCLEHGMDRKAYMLIERAIKEIA